ncbi:MAG: glycosyltransferase [Anaerolineales bacterium]|nr:glycosyltransferase [Anaerolineales bacterium]
MKIACISASQVPSSAANSIQVMKACQALVQAGHQVVLTVPQISAAGSQNRQENIEAYYGLNEKIVVEWLPSNPRFRRYDFAWRAVQSARRWKADLIYTWPLQAAVFSSALGIPTILEMHGPPEGRWGPLLFRFFIRQKGKKRILPITLALLQLLQQTYHWQAPPGSVIISPNGVDLERYQNIPLPAAMRAVLGISQTFTAGYSGHLYPGRGMGLLMDLAQQFPGVQFLWVGGHPEDVAAWRARLEAARLDNITLTGFIANRDLPTYQAAADVLLMPYEQSISGSSGGNSAEYCSPMKMFEYMACNRAIISSNLPVIREVLNSSNAILCPPEDLNAWAAALIHLMENETLRLRLGQQAFEDVQRYTWAARASRALEGFE